MAPLYLYKEDFVDENMWYDILYSLNKDNNATEIAIDVYSCSVLTTEDEE